MCIICRQKLTSLNFLTTFLLRFKFIQACNGLEFTIYRLLKTFLCRWLTMLIYIYMSAWLHGHLSWWIRNIIQKYKKWQNNSQFWRQIFVFPLAFIWFCPDFSYFGKSNLWLCVNYTKCVPFGCIPKFRQIFFNKLYFCHHLFLS